MKVSLQRRDKLRRPCRKWLEQVTPGILENFVLQEKSRFLARYRELGMTISASDGVLDNEVSARATHRALPGTPFAGVGVGAEPAAPGSAAYRIRPRG